MAPSNLNVAARYAGVETGSDGAHESPRTEYESGTSTDLSGGDCGGDGGGGGD